jgi:hypothetical protein
MPDTNKKQIVIRVKYVNSRTGALSIIADTSHTYPQHVSIT